MGSVLVDCQAGYRGFLTALFGEESYERWQMVKHRLGLHTDSTFVGILLQLADCCIDLGLLPPTEDPEEEPVFNHQLQGVVWSGDIGSATAAGAHIMGTLLHERRLLQHYIGQLQSTVAEQREEVLREPCIASGSEQGAQQETVIVIDDTVIPEDVEEAANCVVDEPTHSGDINEITITSENGEIVSDHAQDDGTSECTAAVVTNDSAGVLASTDVVTGDCKESVTSDSENVSGSCEEEEEGRSSSSSSRQRRHMRSCSDPCVNAEEMPPCSVMCHRLEMSDVTYDTSTPDAKDTSLDNDTKFLIDSSSNDSRERSEDDATYNPGGAKKRRAGRPSKKPKTEPAAIPSTTSGAILKPPTPITTAAAVKLNVDVDSASNHSDTTLVDSATRDVNVLERPVFSASFSTAEDLDSFKYPHNGVPVSVKLEVLPNAVALSGPMTVNVHKPTSVTEQHHTPNAQPHNRTTNKAKAPLKVRNEQQVARKCKSGRKEGRMISKVSTIYQKKKLGKRQSFSQALVPANKNATRKKLVVHKRKVGNTAVAGRRGSGGRLGEHRSVGSKRARITAGQETVTEVPAVTDAAVMTGAPVMTDAPEEVIEASLLNAPGADPAQWPLCSHCDEHFLDATSLDRHLSEVRSDEREDEAAHGRRARKRRLWHDAAAGNDHDVAAGNDPSEDDQDEDTTTTDDRDDGTPPVGGMSSHSAAHGTTAMVGATSAGGNIFDRIADLAH